MPTRMISRRAFNGLIAAGTAVGASTVRQRASSEPAGLAISYYGTVPQPVTYLAATGALQAAMKPFGEVKLINVASGPQILTGMASGQIDLGGNIGLPPMVTAFTKGIDVSMIYMGRVHDKNEGLVVRADSGIHSISDMRGKTVGVPYNTEAHFALLKSMEKAQLRLTDVNIINTPPGSIIAAYQRKEIDGAYIWAPMLDQILSDGGRLVTSARELRDAGAPLFEGFLVRNEVKRQRPDAVVAYLKAVEQAHQLFQARSKEVIEPLVKFTNLPINIVEAYMSLYETVPPKDLISSQWMGAPGDASAGVVRSINDVANFLLSTKQISDAPKGLTSYVDSSFAARLV